MPEMSAPRHAGYARSTPTRPVSPVIGVLAGAAIVTDASAIPYLVTSAFAYAAAGMSVMLSV